MFLAEVEAETRAVDVRWEEWPGSASSKRVDSIGFEHDVRSERGGNFHLLTTATLTLSEPAQCHHSG